jgi:hypothetical protein
MSAQTRTITLTERRDQLAAQLAELISRHNAIAAELVEVNTLWRAALDAGTAGEGEARRRRDLEHARADAESAAAQVSAWIAETDTQIERKRQEAELARSEAELAELQGRADALSVGLGQQLADAVNAAANVVRKLLATRAEAAEVQARLEALPVSIQNQRHGLGIVEVPAGSGAWVGGRFVPDQHVPSTSVGVVVPDLAPVPTNGSPTALHTAAAILAAPRGYPAGTPARQLAEAIGHAAAERV